MTVLKRDTHYHTPVGSTGSTANPNYQALKLYTNYDGAHHGFQFGFGARDPQRRRR